MKNLLNLGTKALAFLERGAASEIGRIKIAGTYFYECFDKDGNLKWAFKSHNSITKEGLNHVIDTIFLANPPVTQWYVGIYTAYTGNVLDLTGGDVGGNLTHFTNYTGNRKLYQGIRTNQIISNVLSKAQFAILASGTIAGAFLANTASGTVNTLMSVDSFTSGPKAVTNGDTLNVTYELTASN